MKRILAFILAAAFLFAGCGSDTSAGSASAATAEEIFNKLSEDLSSVDLQSGDLVVKLLGLEEDSVVSCNAAFAKDGGPGLVIVLESKTEDDALKAGERMKYYLTTLQNSAVQYSPADVDILKKGYVYTSGNCSVLYVGENVEDAKKDLAKLLN